MRNNKKLKWFFVLWFILMIAFATLTFPEHKPLKKIAEVSFHVQENEELYFKNIRSYYYETEEREDAQFYLYRLKSRRKDSLQPTLNLTIVNNWRMDQAYILIEPNFDSQQDLQLTFQIDNRLDTLQGDLLNTPKHYELAMRIYETITQEGSVQTLEENPKNLFVKEEDRQAAIRVLKDYFKLVGKF